MTIIGIDLGTTNSACAIWRDGKPRLIPNRLDQLLTPSVVGVDSGGEILVGESAKHRLISHPKRTAAAFKRYMGSRKIFRLGGLKFSEVELSSIVLRSLKEDAEVYLKDKVSKAVISVPAYFNDVQRKATKQAGELAGLQVERLINEPTAAAMVYGLHESADNTQFMILDMGGGTFDVTLVELFSGVMEVHASSGDNFLGGEDFTQAIVDQYMQDHQLDKYDLNATERQHLYNMLDKVKHALSRKSEVIVEQALKQQNSAWRLDRDGFATLVQPLLKRVQGPIERSLRDSDTSPEDVDQIILVGGATRMQVFRSLISKMFRRLPSGHIDPDIVVGMGTAIQAGLKQKNADLSDIVLTDVCPYTLGTDVINHHDHSGEQGTLYCPIIERNTTVPVSIEKTHYTAADNQTNVAVGIYQGEARLTKNNVCIGELVVKVPKGPAGKESIKVRFSYDMNGILDVDVTVVSTGSISSTTIVNSPNTLSEGDIKASREKLARLKFHPRNGEEIRTLIAHLERHFESALGEQRADIGITLSNFEEILERQDPIEIKLWVDKLKERLNDLEMDRLFT